ncbi:interferon-induced protein 35 [Amphiprion ocellaris]|uniref:NID domain-containing protein n=1 Tax=Amphiprion ocellaris TaxID=80972 RepID=A0A3Q1CP12_AMPOC|nr:interferon-induced protein 35 [Amphiprion ocellaris]
MSSDEDFSLVDDPQMSENTLEGVKAAISCYKKKHELLLEEHKELAAARDDRRDMAKQFKQRTDKLIQATKDDQRSHNDQLANEQMKLDQLKLENDELMKELQKVEAALKDQKAENKHLRQQTDVFGAVPEKKVVFTGLTANADDTEEFEMKPHIVYPMEGGTALVTFEEESVAKKILTMKEHKVDLGGECSITVEAKQVHLMLPKLVEIDTDVCPHRILISSLPKMDTEMLLNKLEIHFSKRKHGGGEVDECEMMPDSGNVVLTFVDQNFAKGLTETEYHEVKLLQTKHKVRVTPFLNGKITNLETKMTACLRTVLLTGIPAVMEQETLQDLLEIHFQKNGNGGGEIEAFLYNPVGQQASALFGGISPGAEENK